MILINKGTGTFLDRFIKSVILLVVSVFISNQCYGQAIPLEIATTIFEQDTIRGIILPIESIDSLGAIGAHINNGIIANRIIGKVQNIKKWITGRCLVNRPHIRNVDSLYIVNIHEAQLAEKIFNSFVKKQSRGRRHNRRILNCMGEKCSDAKQKANEIFMSFADYRRQYVGYYYNGCKYVYIIARHRTIQDGQQEDKPILPTRGVWSGDLYLSVFVDVNKEKLMRLYIYWGL
ncbi:MAG: hypothetical protein K6G73_00605 [Marinilabiliaceae bacterium]|nr:hypothetical protein [Marinilabiliaceae bacterium]